MVERILTIPAIIKKLASQVLVFADWDGFAETVLPGAAPGGLLKYVSRLIMTTGVSDWFWWLPYFVLSSLLGFLISLLFKNKILKIASYPIAFIYAFQPIAFLGAGVWLEVECAQPIINLIGMIISVSLFILYRKVFSSVWHNVLIVSLVSSFLIIPFGLYPIISVSAFIAYYAAGAAKESWFKRIVSIVASAVITVAVFQLSLIYIWDDLDSSIAFQKSHAFRFRWNSHVNVHYQLEQEYAINRGDFKKVIEIADKQFRNKVPALRMSVAYRILAQYRLGLLPDKLFDYPMPTSHVNTDAEELKMDGYVLLFNYGFLLPAYREIYEVASVRGWQPIHFKILGDISAINGEFQIALKYYSQLARCPFYSAIARKRIEGVRKADVSAFADIADVGTMNETWKNVFAESQNLFFSTDDNVENFIYTYFRALKKAPEFMVRMFIASALLNGDCEILLDNTALLDSLSSSNAPWPKPVQEAVLFYINNASDEKKNEIIGKIRKFAFAEDVVENFNSFCSTPQEASLNNPFATTYYFYKAFMLPTGNKEKTGEMKGDEK
jgi:hypothetical protein